MEFLSTEFKVLGFPCNNFGLQEPGGNYSEILNGIKYVRPGGGFVPNFQMFKKIDVNGKYEHPLYTYLKSMCGPTSDVFRDSSLLYYEPLHVNDVRWNFEVFLIDKRGIPIFRYDPNAPLSEIRHDIEQLIEPIRSTQDLDTPIVESDQISDDTEESQVDKLDQSEENTNKSESSLDDGSSVLS